NAENDIGTEQIGFAVSEVRMETPLPEAGYATMNRLLGGVTQISNTVDCALQTYFHLNFQFGTLGRSSRRENRFDDIRCEVACVHCAFICFNWLSVGSGA